MAALKVGESLKVDEMGVVNSDSPKFTRMTKQHYGLKS